MRFIIQIPRKVPKEVFKVDKSFKTRSVVTKRTIEVAKAFGLGIDEEKEFTVFKNFEVEINLGDVVLTYGVSGIGK